MNINIKYAECYLDGLKSEDNINKVNEIHRTKMKSSEPMSEWIDHPVKINAGMITKYINQVKKENKIMVVIGTGGSYLGAKAAIDMLGTPGEEKVFFIGPSTDTRYLNYVLSLCMKYDVILNVISKSGSTMETSLYFNIFENFLKEKYKDNWYRHICCTTSESGDLYNIAIKNSYKLFFIPENIGGRFSVISNVGLIPMAFAGIDIEALLNGAQKARLETKYIENNAYKYAVIRNMLYNQGFKIEMFVSYFEYFNSFNEWLKQLFGESEGKDHKGILPCSLEYPTDLHSMGQYMQDGERMIFETQFNIKHPHTIENQYIDKTIFNEIRNATVKGTAQAHKDGGVPVLIFNIDKLDESTVGYLFYFFEMACAMSAHLLKVNPFDQPGVEQYKTNIKNILK